MDNFPQPHPVRLRSWQPEDLLALWEIVKAAPPEWSEMLAWAKRAVVLTTQGAEDPDTAGMESLQTFLNDRLPDGPTKDVWFMGYAVCSQEDPGTIVGSIDLWRVTQPFEPGQLTSFGVARDFEIGGCIAPAYRGAGTPVFAEVTRRLFTFGEADTVRLLTAPDNEKLLTMALKAGFRDEGVVEEIWQARAPSNPDGTFSVLQGSLQRGAMVHAQRLLTMKRAEFERLREQDPRYASANPRVIVDPIED